MSSLGKHACFGQLISPHPPNPAPASSLPLPLTLPHNNATCHTLRVQMHTYPYLARVHRYIIHISSQFLLNQDTMSKEWRDPVHNKRLSLLQLGVGDECRWCRRYSEGLYQRNQHPVDAHEP